MVIARLPGFHIYSILFFLICFLCIFSVIKHGKVTTIPFFMPDRLCTGLAVAEIDLSKIDSVRTKMPISKVTANCY
jgi:hypothetical protein